MEFKQNEIVASMHSHIDIYCENPIVCLSDRIEYVCKLNIYTNLLNLSSVYSETMMMMLGDDTFY